MNLVNLLGRPAPSKHAISSRAWWKRNPDYKRRWKEANPERVAAMDARAKSKPDFAFRTFSASIRKTHHISREAFDAMLIAQTGRCAICEKPFPNHQHNPTIDHDHATGRVRALLCFFCNTGIGKLCDSPEILRAAAAYLDRFTGRRASPSAVSS